MAKRKIKKEAENIKKNKRSSGISRNKALGVLIANLIIPGLGTLIAKDSKQGIPQIVLFVISIYMMFASLSLSIIWLPLMIIIWAWAFAASLIILKKSSK